MEKLGGSAEFWDLVLLLIIVVQRRNIPQTFCQVALDASLKCS